MYSEFFESGIKVSVFSIYSVSDTCPIKLITNTINQYFTNFKNYIPDYGKGWELKIYNSRIKEFEKKTFHLNIKKKLLEVSTDYIESLNTSYQYNYIASIFMFYIYKSSIKMLKVLKKQYVKIFGSFSEESFMSNFLVLFSQVYCPKSIIEFLYNNPINNQVLSDLYLLWYVLQKEFTSFNSLILSYDFLDHITTGKFKLFLYTLTSMGYSLISIDKKEKLFFNSNLDSWNTLNNY